MIIVFLMTLAVLFGGLVLGILFMGRKYEMHHKIGELAEDMNDDEHHLLVNEPAEQSNSEENL